MIITIENRHDQAASDWHRASLYDWLGRFEGDMTISNESERLVIANAPYLWILAHTLNLSAFAWLAQRSPKPVLFPEDERILLMSQEESRLRLEVLNRDRTATLGTIGMSLAEVPAVVAAVERELDGMSFEGLSSSMLAGTWFLADMTLEPDRRQIVRSS